MSAEPVPFGRDRRAVPGVLLRPRLVAVLDAASPQVCVVLGSAGSGKTTLLRSWLATQDEASQLLWLTTGSGVASRAAFWTRMTDAARRNGDLSAGTSAALVEWVARSADPVGVAIDFLSEAAPVTFVIDGYEKLGAPAADIDEDLLRLTQELPQVRVIVAARGRTGLAADQLRLRDRVRVIGDDDLAFTDSEIADLLRTHLERDDAALARSIRLATHGYALAVRAMVLQLSRQSSVPAVDTEQWRRLVAADLASALPDAQAARFVAATSVPPYFDAELAERITGRPDAEATLSVLEREGFGRWIPFARQQPVFQYVESVRDAFARELRRGSEVAYRRSADLSARWTFSGGDHEAAFDLALIAKDYALAAQIYLDLLREVPECYFTDRLLGPLSSIPVSVLRQHPMLAFALGLARLTHPVARVLAPEAFTLVVSSPARTEIVRPELDAFVDRSLRAVSLRLIGRFTDAARGARAAIAELDHVPAERRDQFGELIAMVLRQLSYNLLLGGGIDEAVATMNRSAALTAVPATRNYALSYLIGSHAFAGDLPAARAAKARIDPDGWPREYESSYLNAMTRIGEGWLQLDALDFAGALDTITDSTAYTDTTEFWPLFTLVALYAEFALGQGLSAARRIEARLHATPHRNGTGENTTTRALLGALAVAWMSAGRLARAERILDAAPPRAAEFVPARVLHLILTERSPTAVERLSRWLALPRHTIRSRAATLALGAAAARRAGDDRLAVTLAARAHDLHLAHGVRAHLAMLPAEDRQGLAVLAGEAGDHGTAAHLLGATTSVVPAAVPRIVLTDKELAVLAELAGTASRDLIAARLGVSANTVKSQVSSLYRKLGVSRREAAISAAIEYELLERP